LIAKKFQQKRPYHNYSWCNLFGSREEGGNGGCK